MREKQIEELAQVIAHSCIDLVESSCGEGECCASCLATKLHKEGVIIQKWIPVTERLPEESGEYLAYCGGYDGICVLHYEILKTKGKWRSKWKEVTHWMPLPEPPKGE